MLSYAARTVGVVWSHQLASCTASASRASVGHTVRMSRGVSRPAKTEEPASKTHPTHSSTAATAPRTSLDDTVRTKHLYYGPRPAPICSVSVNQGIKCVTISVTIMIVSGMEETARSTGSSLGLTAPPAFPAGISLKMDVVIKSVTTLVASLTALSAKTPHLPSASM